MAIQTHSVLTCPACGHSAEEEMPEDACVYFYECRACGALLKPNKGHCCVFCSFGTVKMSANSSIGPMLCTWAMTSNYLLQRAVQHRGPRLAAAETAGPAAEQKR